MKTINDRIEYLINKNAQGSNSKFARIIGSSEANVRNYRKSVAPKIDVLQSIADKFAVNYEWLIDGVGPVYKSEIDSGANESYEMYSDARGHISALEDHILTLKEQIKELKSEIKAIKNEPIKKQHKTNDDEFLN